ncbi:hypothetical protein OHA72_20425 [Dactylosporangium sp. NBC_01737]|uniref:hypothetical protein n=1 Tax=Dactylosporangium sp. NBC_01737 TaxID=2975959 RepID=UPI002E113200|nr:hypothetical protein OHA72_20425 [Dactylosporangium sp. NBC_01737]
MGRERRLSTSLLTLIVAAGLAVAGSPAGAAPVPDPAADGPSLAGLPAKFRSWDELFAVQQVLDSAATRIEDAAGARPGSGFTSLSVDPETASLTVYWNGPPSAAEATVLAAVRRSGIKVRLVPARYSRAQLDAQVSLIAQDAGAAGEQIVRITKRPDGSGVDVAVAAAPGIDPNASPPGHSLPHLRAAQANGHVTVTPAGDPPALASRQYDDGYGGLSGGSLVRAVLPDEVSWCSSGFAVRWNGGDYLTTADHCRFTGYDVKNGDRVIGHGTPGPGIFYDLAFIQTPGGSLGRIFTGVGAYAQGTQGYLPVKTASHTNVGDWLCVSGAFTGWACSIRASGPTLDCYNKIDGVCVRVEGGISSVGQKVMGDGDSGGPVWLPINGITNPNSGVNARGIIHSSPDNASGNFPRYDCLDQVRGGIRDCWTAFWFTDLIDAIQPWVSSGMYVKTL